MGGTGTVFRLGEGAADVFTSAKTRKGRLVAAGGLTPGNVGEAIVKLRPWGVDAVSGVEAEPGKKDAGEGEGVCGAGAGGGEL